MTHSATGTVGRSAVGATTDPIDRRPPTDRLATGPTGSRHALPGRESGDRLRQHGRTAGAATPVQHNVLLAPVEDRLSDNVPPVGDERSRQPSLHRVDHGVVVGEKPGN
ncbi:hypothetical protein [Micromonospora sp. NRRL B-16802]|uniref:hypothetical protein n=1 Tax=Micromonospora sp. NRRL B-16802 TaxID=1415541 RepID=UPI0012F7D41B|nr:hypothetical protein [Micromonospora sp. NRRL B-16802]